MAHIAFIGVGNVGGPLAQHLAAVGHTVRVAVRDTPSAKTTEFLGKNTNITALPSAEAVAQADIIFLAVPYAAATTALQQLPCTGKIIVDCTNPVGPGLSHGLKSETSGSEVIQQAAPSSHVVKAFTIYGYENFIDSNYPAYNSVKPAMLIAGDSTEAKTTVAALCAELGFEAVDTGPLSSSLHLEHMTLLWIKMARAQGLGPDFVWGQLRR